MPPAPGGTSDDGTGTTDVELAALPAPRPWRGLGLRGPAILWRFFTRNARRFLVLVVGVAVLGAGVAMLVLPGPGVVVVIVGLAILATEFAWAERALDRATAGASRAVGVAHATPAGRWLLVVSGLGLVVAGIVVPLVLGTGVALGVGLVVAGVVGLATLTGPVQRWLERQQRGR
jgi:hypothetical protein